MKRYLVAIRYPTGEQAKVEISCYALHKHLRPLEESGIDVLSIESATYTVRFQGKDYELRKENHDV
jgi:hypothetical protein